MTVNEEIVESFPPLYRVTVQGKQVWHGEDWQEALAQYRRYRAMGYRDGVRLECW
jgi:hypothetical protein